MDEITPDLVARVASRLYNASPSAPALDHLSSPEAALPGLHPSGLHLPATPVPPDPTGVFPAAPTQFPVGPQSVPSPGGYVPRLPESPAAAGVPGAGSLAGFVLPGFAAQPSSAGPPSSASGGPSPATPATPGGSEGLSAFVARVRQAHFTSGDLPDHAARPFCLADVVPGLRERLSGAGSAGTGNLVSMASARPLDVPAIRQDFPILRQKVNGKPIVWFDNAATTQKPQSVIDAIARFYENDNSNIHRAAHTLAARATDAYEKARQKVQSFLGASSPQEIVFVRGTTEGINLITQTFGRKFLSPGDEVVLSTLEHHANIVPWQMAAKERGAVLRVIPVNDQGEILLEEYQRILGPRTRVVALTHASNSLGTILPVAEMTQMAKRYGARVLIDGAQSVAHIPVNVQQLGCDFYVFSGHKIFGPTGIGAAFIKHELHDILPPWQGGGNMIRNVTFEETTYSDAPAKFEAGTPNIADAVGLGAALDYVSRLGLANIAAYEHELLVYATEQLSKIGGLRLIGTAREKVGVLSFVLPHLRSEEIGRLLDQEGIAVRSGHHCSQPSLRRFGVETTVRPSLSFYNTRGEIERLVDAIRRIQRVPPSVHAAAGGIR